MLKDKIYYLAVTAEVMLKDNSKTTISGYVRLKPGCDKVWMVDELKKTCNKTLGINPEEIVITSLSEISRGLYNRLTNQEN